MSIKIAVERAEPILLNRSKSILIRELIATYLYRGEVLSVEAEDARDVHIVHRVLQQLHRAKSQPTASPIIVDVEDCGAAYRFFAAVLSVTAGYWLLTGTERLRKRPIAPLLTTLREAGARIEETPAGLHIVGTACRADQLTVDCSTSSQYASAICFIAPSLHLKQLLTEPASPPSQGYIEMTCAIIEQVRTGVPVCREGDWSSAVFWYLFFAASPTHDTLQMPHLYLTSLQSDHIVAAWFRDLGVETHPLPNAVQLTRSKQPVKKSVHLDFSQNLDLAPVMAVAPALLAIDLTMSGVRNLNFKESERLKHLVTVLSQVMPIQVVDADQIICYGSQRSCPQAPLISPTFDDHRLVMAFALLSLITEVEIDAIEPVKKSYPQLVKYLKS